MQKINGLTESISVFPGIFLMDSLRYLIPAGVAFLVFYVVFQIRLQKRKIQAGVPGPAQFWREIGYSVSTIVIFSVVGLCVYWMIRLKITLLYEDVKTLGIPYFFLSIFISIFLHDAYFYWLHRFLHTGVLYRLIHKIHHRSTSPSPWAAYAFHPVEAILQSLIIPILTLILPLHPLALGSVLVIQIVRNVLGHSGFEILPAVFGRHKLLRLIQSNTEHDLHHQFTRGNYGLYFTFWDRLFSTDRPDSVTKFLSITESSAKSANKKGKIK